MDPTDQPMLAFEGGPDEGKTVGLGGTTTLGREPTNDVVVTEPGASRQHAEIVESDDGFRLRDLNSTNGTFVNDRRVRGREHLLKDGDRIRLGSAETSLVFRLPAAIEVKPDPSQGEPQPAAPAPVRPAEEEIGADTLAEKLSEGPVPPSVAVPLEVEPAEAAPPAPSKTGLAGLMHRIALGLKLKRSRAPEAPSPEVETTPQVSLPLLTRMSRAVRNLREDFDLRRRRRTFALSEEAGIVRVVVFEGQEIVAWGTVDPREDDPFPDDGAAQPAEADEERAPALQSAAQEPGSQPGARAGPHPRR